MSRHVQFGEMSWPAVDETLDDLNWRLRYASDGLASEARRGDVLSAASVLSAYRALIDAPKRKRDYVVRMIRKLSSPGPTREGTP